MAINEEIRKKALSRGREKLREQLLAFASVDSNANLQMRCIWEVIDPLAQLGCLGLWDGEQEIKAFERLRDRVVLPLHHLGLHGEAKEQVHEYLVLKGILDRR